MGGRQYVNEYYESYEQFAAVVESVSQSSRVYSLKTPLPYTAFHPQMCLVQNATADYYMAHL